MIALASRTGLLVAVIVLGLSQGAPAIDFEVTRTDECGLVELDDQAAVPVEDVALGELQFAGGPTMTPPLLEGSLALDRARASACSPQDQRGVVRPQGPGCDTGAYERSFEPEIFDDGFEEGSTAGWSSTIPEQEALEGP